MLSLSICKTNPDERTLVTVSAFKWLQKYVENGPLTSAGASVRRHGVPVFRTCALIAPRNVHTLVGAQMADALRALVDVWGDTEEYQSGEKDEVFPKYKSGTQM